MREISLRHEKNPYKSLLGNFRPIRHEKRNKYTYTRVKRNKRKKKRKKREPNSKKKKRKKCVKTINEIELYP